MIFFVQLNKNNHYHSITYQININTLHKTLLVNAKFHGNFKDKQIMELPYKWANNNYRQQINNIKILSQHKSFELDQTHSNQLTIYLIKPLKELEIAYEIHLPGDKQNFEEQSSIFDNDLLHVLGHNVFVLPGNILDSDRLKVKIKWNDLPNNWQIYSSFGDGNAQEFVVSEEQLLHSIYIAGKPRIYKKFIENKVVNFSIYGKFDFTDEIMIDNAVRIIASQRNFFNDYGYKNYLVSIIENPDNNEKQASIFGSTFNNSLLLNFTKNISLTQLKLLIAHEHLHNWLGIKIRNSEEALNYWWSEGFTEYYTRILLAKNNILNINILIDELNNFLKSYYTSPVIRSNNDNINNDFWFDSKVEHLPYLRGFVFALGLNCKIKNINYNFSTDLILNYFNQHDVQFSNENFIKALMSKNIYNNEIEKFYRKSIILGEVISLSDCLNYLPIQSFYDVNKGYDIYSLKNNLNDLDLQQIKEFFGIK